MPNSMKMYMTSRPSIKVCTIFPALNLIASITVREPFQKHISNSGQNANDGSRRPMAKAIVRSIRTSYQNQFDMSTTRSTFVLLRTAFSAASNFSSSGRAAKASTSAWTWSTSVFVAAKSSTSSTSSPPSSSSSVWSSSASASSTSSSSTPTRMMLGSSACTNDTNRTTTVAESKPQSTQATMSRIGWRVVVKKTSASESVSCAAMWRSNLGRCQKGTYAPSTRTMWMRSERQNEAVQMLSHLVTVKASHEARICEWWFSRSISLIMLSRYIWFFLSASPRSASYISEKGLSRGPPGMQLWGSAKNTLSSLWSRSIST
mmetsp:Transcript_10303/g.22989  ORF Transcript_10303/g.22989 Transcript_10303/m.22989 type:complete len:318 (-) Transcript_10303:5710-6663(-)